MLALPEKCGAARFSLESCCATFPSGGVAGAMKPSYRSSMLPRRFLCLSVKCPYSFRDLGLLERFVGSGFSFSYCLRGLTPLLRRFPDSGVNFFYFYRGLRLLGRLISSSFDFSYCHRSRAPLKGSPSLSVSPFWLHRGLPAVVGRTSLMQSIGL